MLTSPRTFTTFNEFHRAFITHVTWCSSHAWVKWRKRASWSTHKLSSWNAIKCLILCAHCGNENENGKKFFAQVVKTEKCFYNLFFAFPRSSQLPTPPLIALGAGIMFLCWVAAEVFSTQAYLLKGRESLKFSIFAVTSFVFIVFILVRFSCWLIALSRLEGSPQPARTQLSFSLFNIQ